MRAELKAIDCADAVDGLAAFIPADPDNFAIAVAAHIGPSGGPGADLFYFNVCTASWLASNPPPKCFEFLKGHLLVARWDYGLIERAIRDLCVHAKGADWDQVAAKLARYGNWEFEDYREAH